MRPLESETKMNANVMLCRCGQSGRLYGIRIEERNNDWVMTWAFPLKEDIAKREGYDSIRVHGSFRAVDDYPGCPFCHTNGFIVCGKCGKISCYNNEELSKCEWCGNMSKAVASDCLKVTSGEY